MNSTANTKDKMKKALGTITLAVSVLMTVACNQAAPAASTQAPAPAAKQLTPEEALIAAGEADATPGFTLYSALTSKKSYLVENSKDKNKPWKFEDTYVCYSYYRANGGGDEYLDVTVTRDADTQDLISSSNVFYHKDGFAEASNGRSFTWDHGFNPCKSLNTNKKHTTELIAASK